MLDAAALNAFRLFQIRHPEMVKVKRNKRHRFLGLLSQELMNAQQERRATSDYWYSQSLRIIAAKRKEIATKFSKNTVARPEIGERSLDNTIHRTNCRQCSSYKDRKTMKCCMMCCKPICKEHT
uniref:PiggyBac transposable element-derived protein domain-containing protein n=1 Tax=Romanomermis culicivorax TaxID=13658 RepID=A0A915K3V7_ROMCU